MEKSHNQSTAFTIGPSELDDEYDYTRELLYKYFLSLFIIQNFIVITSTLLYLFVFGSTPAIFKQRNKWICLHAVLILLVNQLFITATFLRDVHKTWSSPLSCKFHRVFDIVIQNVSIFAFMVVAVERALSQMMSVADTPGFHKNIIISLFLATWFVPSIQGITIIYGDGPDPFFVSNDQICFLKIGQTFAVLHHAIIVVYLCVAATCIVLLIMTNYGPHACLRIQSPPIQVLHIVVGASIILVPTAVAMVTHAPYLHLHNHNVSAALFAFIRTGICLQATIWMMLDTGMRQRLKHYFILVKVHVLLLFGRQQMGDHIEMIPEA